LQGRGVIPLVRERCAHAREVGRVLLDKFDGQCARLVERSSFDAAGVSQSVIEHFSSFRDAPVYHGLTVPIYKRAQIVAADLYGAYGGERWGALKGVERLTCFADYKLPQILRRWGVLRYSDSLAQRIDARIEISAGSDEEIEIRALTVAAVERMRAALSTRRIGLNSVEIDWALWDTAQVPSPDGKPYHRTRTIYY
jgi:Potential Queuosine, Q, salvage protein family